MVAHTIPGFGAPRPCVHFLAHPFDDDKLKEEITAFSVSSAFLTLPNFVALGLHALQHRGQEAGGIVSYDPVDGFNSVRRFGYVRSDNFTKHDVMQTLPGSLAIGHVRYSTAGSRGPPPSATFSPSSANSRWAALRLPTTAT